MNPETTMAFVEAMRKSLTPRALDILDKMLVAEEADDYENAELVNSGGQVWLGEDRTSRKILDDLLCACVIRAEEEMGSKFERFTLNEDGRAIVAAHRKAKAEAA